MLKSKGAVSSNRLFDSIFETLCDHPEHPERSGTN